MLEDLYLSIQAAAFGGNIPLMDLRLSCSVPSNMMVLELTAREQCQRLMRPTLLWGKNVSEGGSGLPSHPPGSANLQIFQFYCQCHQKDKIKLLTSFLPPFTFVSL